MVLVDYTSSSDESSSEKSESETAVSLIPAAAATHPAPPPLPRAFHDLYATNVRTSTTDDPSLHQGRTRATPHVAGHWPSHIYVEWFPTTTEHASLSRLLATVRTGLGQPLDSRSTASSAGIYAIHSLLSSDLGTPLPLHISLSRPFVLSTTEKTTFLDRLISSVASSRVTPFYASFCDLDWYHGPDSPRAFLVLRVASTTTECNAKGSAIVADTNKPLLSLLERCNTQVAAVDQPTLYAQAPSNDRALSSNFHISIAWTLADNIYAWSSPTAEAYNEWQRDAQATTCCMLVDSIKAKIGNVVTNIPLATSHSLST